MTGNDTVRVVGVGRYGEVFEYQTLEQPKGFVLSRTLSTVVYVDQLPDPACK